MTCDRGGEYRIHLLDAVLLCATHSSPTFAARPRNGTDWTEMHQVYEYIRINSVNITNINTTTAWLGHTAVRYHRLSVAYSSQQPRFLEQTVRNTPHCTKRFLMSATIRTLRVAIPTVTAKTLYSPQKQRELAPKAGLRCMSRRRSRTSHCGTIICCKPLHS